MTSRPAPTNALTTACRKALPLFASGALVPAKAVAPGVRALLLERGLVHDLTAPGYLQATARAQGYIANPRTFEA